MQQSNNKQQILLVGQNPYGTTGNSHMLRSIIDQIDKTIYDPVCFAIDTSDDLCWEIYDRNANVPVIMASSGNKLDPLGQQKLLNILTSNPDIKAVVFVGLDIWIYAKIFHYIRRVCDRHNIVWVQIFPYDLQYIRNDWLGLINMVDVPCVYSEYGLNMLKPYLKKIRYFRPPLYLEKILKPLPVKERLEIRHELFPSIKDTDTIFGFIGKNQLRKRPDTHVKAFWYAREMRDDIAFFCHTDMKGEVNIEQIIQDIRFRQGSFFKSRVSPPFADSEMLKMYNALDCVVLCSMQEGLSWVPIEAGLCGVPTILSHSTAHMELKGAGKIYVPCETPDDLPLWTRYGSSRLPTKRCKVYDVFTALFNFHKSYDEKYINEIVAHAQDWCKGVNDINELLKESLEDASVTVSINAKRQEILFAQHSSAGDVLMTTRCLKPIKEKHPGKRLVYMTQKKYRDIVEGNPYIDEIIDWDVSQLNNFTIRYSPHGDKILPGGWNNGDVKLADMYPYFCKVDPADFFIEEKFPALFEENSLKYCLDSYVVVHTTGGQAEYRTYKHMDIAVNNLGIPVVQVGGASDYACQNATLDLRGKLTFRETAWVMKRAKAAVCVDSFPMHLAGALGTPLVALFGPAPARVTQAIGDPNKIINLEPDKLEVCDILSNCWGDFKKGYRCQSPCINTINPLTVREALTKLLKVNNSGKGGNENEN